MSRTSQISWDVNAFSSDRSRSFISCKQFNNIIDERLVKKQKQWELRVRNTLTHTNTGTLHSHLPKVCVATLSHSKSNSNLQFSFSVKTPDKRRASSMRWKYAVMKNSHCGISCFRSLFKVRISTGDTRSVYGSLHWGFRATFPCVVSKCTCPFCAFLLDFHDL